MVFGWVLVVFGWVLVVFEWVLVVLGEESKVLISHDDFLRGFSCIKNPQSCAI